MRRQTVATVSKASSQEARTVSGAGTVHQVGVQSVDEKRTPDRREASLKRELVELSFNDKEKEFSGALPAETQAGGQEQGSEGLFVQSTEAQVFAVPFEPLQFLPHMEAVFLPRNSNCAEKTDKREQKCAGSESEARREEKRGQKEGEERGQEHDLAEEDLEEGGDH